MSRILAVIIDDLAELAEALGEAKLVLRLEMLVAKQQDRVAVPSVEDLGKLRIAQGRVQIHADDLGADYRRKRDRGYGFNVNECRRRLRRIRFHAMCPLWVLAAHWRP